MSLFDKPAVLRAMINEMPFTALNRKTPRILGNFKVSNALSSNGDHGTGSGFIFFQSALCNRLTSKKKLSVLQVIRHIIRYPDELTVSCKTNLISNFKGQ
jgi:hypothetical protein